MDQITALEERIAHLTRAVDDLSDVVTRQSRDIEVLQRRVQMLMQREADRELSGQDMPEANKPPPHW